ncbi:superoxide dismutase, Ni [SAR86 cluster bacterium]|nr:superoxide dismutase, Ni [SAR86 cluster bacterium]
MNIEIAKAHCDIPCKVYDPAIAQFGALSVVRLMDLINELEDITSVKNAAQLTRLVAQKEEHAQAVKNDVATIWGDYFKGPQIEKYPDVHSLVHNIMQAASKCKQGIDRNDGLALMTMVNDFAGMFWGSKDMEIETIVSPNLPNLDVVRPKS